MSLWKKIRDGVVRYKKRVDGSEIRYPMPAKKQKGKDRGKAKRKPKDWRAKRKKRRKMAKESRRRNRSANQG
jgi:hypothetical protein